MAFALPHTQINCGNPCGSPGTHPAHPEESTSTFPSTPAPKDYAWASDPVDPSRDQELSKKIHLNTWIDVTMKLQQRGYGMIWRVQSDWILLNQSGGFACVPALRPSRRVCCAKEFAKKSGTACQTYIDRPLLGETVWGCSEDTSWRLLFCWSN